MSFGKTRPKIICCFRQNRDGGDVGMRAGEGGKRERKRGRKRAEGKMKKKEDGG